MQFALETKNKLLKSQKILESEKNNFSMTCSVSKNLSIKFKF